MNDVQIDTSRMVRNINPADSACCWHADERKD
jgi:hypothetical protein